MARIDYKGLRKRTRNGNYFAAFDQKTSKQQVK